MQQGTTKHWMLVSGKMSDETLVTNKLAQSLQVGDYTTFKASLSLPTGPATMSHKEQAAAVFSGLLRNAWGVNLVIPKLNITAVAAKTALKLASGGSSQHLLSQL